MNYQQLKVFCSAHKDEIEGLIGHSIRCQDKGATLLSYHQLIEDQKKTKKVSPKKSPKKASPKKPLPKVVPIKQAPTKKAPAKKKVDLEGKGFGYCGIDTVDNNYRLIKLLGEGGFGSVYQAEDLKTKEEVAIKITFSDKGITTAQNEVNVLTALQGLTGIPQLISSSTEKAKKRQKRLCHVIIFQLLGPSLRQRKNDNSLPPLSVIAPQMISRLEAIHNRGWIHRDVKPDNWVFGLGAEKDMIYLIDFGLARRYLYGNGDHIDYRTDNSFQGTYVYASANIEHGITASRRDDLISLGYSLASLYVTLPWREKYVDFKEKSYNQKEAILDETGKMKRSLAQLCPSPTLDPAICKFIQECYKISFDEKPNYNKLRKLF